MRRLLALAAVALFATACGGSDSTNPGTENISGTYTLRTVNNAPLPYLYYQSGADKYELLDDAITLQQNGTWSEVWHERETINGTASTYTYTDAGSYTRQGSAVTLSSQGGTLGVTVASGTLTLNAQGLVAIYQK